MASPTDLLKSFNGAVPILNEKNGRMTRPARANVARAADQGKHAKQVGPSGVRSSGRNMLPAHR